jgi:succinyl-CoA synthetase beta subunit
VAQGVVQAMQQTELDVPLVVRLAGTHVEQGRQILKDSNMPVVPATNLKDAAYKAVEVLNNPTGTQTFTEVASA